MPTINQLIRKPRHGLTVAQQGAGAAGLPAEARRLHARLHDHAEEAELGAAQGRHASASPTASK